MAAETVRIHPQTHAKLREMAKHDGRSMADVLEDAIEQLRRRRVLEETARAYAALRDDPEAWQAELEEREAWDASLADGQKDD